MNPASKLDRYPIPKIEDLFAKLSEGKRYTELDLSQAYLQVPLDEESKKLLVVNTPKGLPVHQTSLWSVLSSWNFPKTDGTRVTGHSKINVIVYIEDILVTGVDEKEHLKTLSLVLPRLEKAGFHAKKSKCQFMAPSVSYLGYLINQVGLHPLQEKVKAVKDTPCPQNFSELKSHLGLLTYYSKFLPNMADVLAASAYSKRCELEMD